MWLKVLIIVATFQCGIKGTSAFVIHANSNTHQAKLQSYSTRTKLPTTNRVASSTSSSSSTTTTTMSSSALMAFSSGSVDCRPVGVGHAVPEKCITNVDLESIVETNDEWIRTRTGIAQRRVLTEGQSLRSLGAQAAAKALENANIPASDIDLVICATSSPDDMFGDAPSIASELGCSKDTMAFDLTAACSGFLFATVTASQFMASNNNNIKNVLVIGADALSRWVDWDNRNVCILFGDGAGAMVLTKNDNDASGESELPGILGYSAHSNGQGYEDLKLL